MLKRLFLMLSFALLLAFVGCSSESPSQTEAAVSSTSDISAAITTPVTTSEPTLSEKIEDLASDVNSKEDIKALRALVWEEYARKIAEEEPSRSKEIKRNATTNITIGKTTMKVRTRVVGKPEGEGYPLFLIYHGGGYDPNDQYNESQWEGMIDRYDDVPGIYCSIRSVSDNETSGQIFSTNVSWKFYDRIIENCILYMNASPNKVYIVGYSAGGNGVYQIAPRITDRLAAANMTAGHPEGIDLTNLYNLPFYLQVGELDSAYNRNTITVEYAQKLDGLAALYGGGYYYKCFVHSGKAHGVVGDNKSDQSVIADNSLWLDAQKSGNEYTGGTVNTETHAAKLMNAHVRDPLPERIIMNAETTYNSGLRREIRSFYWISTKARSGNIDISYDKTTNTITVLECSIKNDITIYLSEDMVDLFSTVKIVMPDGSTEEFMPQISLDLLRETTDERGDPNYQFCASYTFRID